MESKIYYHNSFILAVNKNSGTKATCLLYPVLYPDLHFLSANLQ